MIKMEASTASPETSMGSNSILQCSLSKPQGGSVAGGEPDGQVILATASVLGENTRKLSLVWMKSPTLKK